MVDEGEDLLLVHPVVAGGDAVDAGMKQIVGDGAREAEAARRILAVGDDEIEFERFLEARQLGRDHVAPRPPHDVADEKKVHEDAVSQNGGDASGD